MKRLIVLAALVVLAASCARTGSGDLGPVEPESSEPSPTQPTVTPEPTQSPSSQPTGDGTMTFEVWFASGEGYLFVTHRTEPASPRIGTAAVEALLAGPSATERGADVGTAVPEGSQLLGLTVEDGLATVDLSREFESGGGSLSMMLRLAQLTYTLTQFPTVDAVSLELDGKAIEVFSGEGLMVDHPMTRKAWDDLLPAILVEQPGIGEQVSSPFTVVGSADVFEATVSISLLDAAGNEIVRTFTTATCGTGCRGTFEKTIRYEVPSTQTGTLRVYEASAENGEPINVVEIPIVLSA
ncbi:MAG TPA: Gmad2 immunoglobulin-like domain-containing protein [Actinomycetota bacterium]